MPLRPGPSNGRRALDWLVALLAALFTYAYMDPLLREWHVPPVLSTVLALALSAALVVPFAALVRARGSREYGIARVRHPAWSAFACSASVLIALQVADASGASGSLVSSPWWMLAAGAIVWSGAYRYARRTRQGLLDRILEVGGVGEAGELAELCSRELEDAALSRERRTIVSLTLAGALISLSSSPSHEDALARALAILDAALADSASPETVFVAAAEMVTAMRAKRRRTGDDIGYDRALELMADAATQASSAVPAAAGLVEAAWAQRLADDAELDGSGDRADALLAHAIERLDRAVDATSDRLPEHALHVATRARLIGGHPLRGDLDGSIVACRGAVRRLRRLGSQHLATTQLALADLLELRAAVAPSGGFGAALERALPDLRRIRLLDALWPDRDGNDLARALVLCLKVSAGEGEAAARARERLPRLRDGLIRGERLHLPATLEGHTGWMYRQVVRAQLPAGGGAAAEVCERWAAWAEARGDEQQAAEAWWCWVSAVGGDLRRRVLDGKHQRLSQVQGLFVEASDRLARVGRAQNAALALDLGRAVLLTEHMDRERQGLEARLVEQGRHELATRWRRLVDRIDALDRGAPSGAGEATLAGLASAEYTALADYEALLREIALLPDFEDVDAAPVYDDLRRAARDGPIAYLAALEDRGFALLVDPIAPEPIVIALPRMHRARVDGHVDRVRAARDPVDVSAVMATLLPDLWTDVLEPLVDHVAAPSLMTLVPIGSLGELPLHAAGAALDAGDIWRDRTGGIVVRYSPNARVLLRAQRTAEAVSQEEPRLLTAAVPNAPGKPPLTHAAIESSGVAACFASGHAARPDPPTVANVVPLLDEATVWHFACHGTHDPQAPLDSTLELSDGPLTARTLLGGRRGQRRLAVLSACQTARIGDVLPDEVIGFSSALLQAGVAGVVSCQAEVDDAAATLLVLTFFARMAHERSPAYALASAQAWLRSATNEELHAAFPDVHAWTDDRREVERWRRYRPFADPSTWVVFNYTGA
jgi:CHAT domain-containing protein